MDKAGQTDVDAAIPSSVHRVYVVGCPRFQLRKGEAGLSTFDADHVRPEDILPWFRPGSQILLVPVDLILACGLTLERTEGDAKLPATLRGNHWEILPGEGMDRNAFKKDALRKLEAAMKEAS